MARMRTLKPEAATSETLAEVPRSVRWTFALLWTHCDDEGRCAWNPKLIKAALYPLDDDVSTDVLVSEVDQLEAVDAVCVYEVEGKQYLHVPSWHDHQHPNRKVESKLPACPRGEGSDHVRQGRPERSISTDVQRSEHAVSTQPQLTPVVVVEGRVVGGVDGEVLAPAPRPPRKQRPPDELWDAIIEACRLDGTQMTDTARGSANRARRELAAVGATPEQVRLRAGDYRRQFPTASLTPPALVKHWPQLAGQPQQRFNPDGTAVGEGKPW